MNYHANPKIEDESIKTKYSSKVLEGIIKFYNNYNNNRIPINKDNIDENGNENNIERIKCDINDSYDDINSNKIFIIYNYYELYNEYLKEKKQNNKLKFVDFIEYENKEISRYTEKVHICYKFIKDILEFVKDVLSCFENDKKIPLINVLSRCKLSINKLYKIRNKEYKELLDFLNPLCLEKCEESYNNNKKHIDLKKIPK
jgi:hypothetical protein